MSDQGDGIFREIDEEVRRDQLLALWKRYGRFFVGLLVLLVAAAASYQLWSNYRESQFEQQSAIYEEAVEAAAEAPPGERAASFARLAGELTGGYALLAKLRQAHALMESNDFEAAATLYEEVAEAADDARLADYARYLAAMAMLEFQGPDAAIAQLGPIAQSDSPIYYSALELLGVAYLEAGDTEAARSQFAAITEDPAAPQALKSRAEDILTLLPSPSPAAASNTAATPAAGDGAAGESDGEDSGGLRP